MILRGGGSDLATYSSVVIHPTIFPKAIDGVVVRVPDTSTDATGGSGTSVVWADEAAAAQRKKEAHIASPEYKAMHRPPMTNLEMGGYGGEAGFEKSPRVWVDPDRPHLKHIFNSTALAANLRYSRYGHFKGDFHIIDVDKLLRHARMVPAADKVLTDFINAKVPLKDESCAAIIRHAARSLRKTSVVGLKERQFVNAMDMFERMLVTAMPPIDAGGEAHAEMVRLCAAVGKWEEGYSWLRQRAMEEAEEGRMALGANFYDATIELCARCGGKVEEAVADFERLLKCNLRVRPSTLSNMLLLFAKRNCSRESASSTLFVEEGKEVWRLYDYFDLKRTPQCYTNYAAWAAVTGLPDLALDALAHADRSGVPLPLSCFTWLLFSVRRLPAFGGFVLDVLSQLQPRGLAPDYRTIQQALTFCALNGDGDAAIEVLRCHLPYSGMNFTPEIVYLLLVACGTSPAPSPTMLAFSMAAIDKVEKVGSSLTTLNSDIYQAFFILCAQLGAIATAHGALKKVMASAAVNITTPMVNALLLCNAASVSVAREGAFSVGAASMTEELLSLMFALQLKPSRQTVSAVEKCIAAHGPSDEIDDLCSNRLKIPLRSTVELADDPPLPMLDETPFDMRALHSDWAYDHEESRLRKLGSMFRKPKEREHISVKRTLPFGTNSDAPSRFLDF